MVVPKHKQLVVSGEQLYSLANPTLQNCICRSRVSLTASLTLWGMWWVPMENTAADDFALKNLLG